MFPATRSNQITYAYFCQLGGLSNPATWRIERRNGSHSYYTYHLVSVR
jgi:hypothetical protein